MTLSWGPNFVSVSSARQILHLIPLVGDALAQLPAGLASSTKRGGTASSVGWSLSLVLMLFYKDLHGGLKAKIRPFTT